MADDDVVATFLGPFGKWQLRSTLLIFLVKIPSAWFMACLIFTAKSPTPGEIFCKPPNNLIVNDTNLWIESAHEEKFSRVENEEGINFCEISVDAVEEYLNSSSNFSHDVTSLKCTNFDHKPTFYSIIHQYELFCSREALVALTQSFHLLGVLIGGVIAFYMLKKISPRQTMLIGMVSQIFLGIATGFAPTYELHLFFRCSVAATCSLMCIGIMIVSDISFGKARVICVCLFEQFWSIGVILLPFVGGFWDSWSLIYIAITLPTISLIAIYNWIPDSPRWLLKHGRAVEAMEILVEAARVNDKKDFTEDELLKKLTTLSEEMMNSPPEPTLFSIWKGPEVMRFKLFAAHIGWSIYLMLYFTSLLHVRAMGRDYLKVNTIIAGSSELVGTFIGLYFILNTTRKWLWASLLNIATSIIAFSANFVSDTVPPFERMEVYMATSMIMKISISTSLAIFITSMSEVVTLDKKKTSNYSGVTCSRTLVIIAPFFGHCVIFGQLVPQNIMAFLNVAAAILVGFSIKTSRTITKETTSATTEITSL